MKIKYLRANQGKSMTEDLHKAIMKSSRLANKFLRDTTEMPRKAYKNKEIFVLTSWKRPKNTSLQILM